MSKEPGYYYLRDRNIELQKENDNLRKIICEVRKGIELLNDIERLKNENNELKKIIDELKHKDSTEQIIQLEKFMIKIARELNCLPSFADPFLGNDHIYRKLQELKNKK